MVNYFATAETAPITTPTPPPAQLPGFEVDYAVNRMLGRPELWWQAVGLFIQHFADWENQWLATRHDLTAEGKCVHALRSAAANVGANHLCCVAGILEELLAKAAAGQARTTVPPSLRFHLQDCFREVWRTATDAYFGDQGYPGRLG